MDGPLRPPEVQRDSEARQVTGLTHRQVVAFPFGDADMAKILYFPRLFHYCHMVMEGFVLHSTGKSYQSLLDDRRLGFPTVHTEAEYAAPMPYGRDLAFEFVLTHLGTSSLKLQFTARMEGEERVRAIARSTVVCVDMDRFESVLLPADLRRAFAPYLHAPEAS